jgi:DNA mismatch repair protein MutS2
MRREAVPLDFELGESFDAVIISGPNMGGKTVVLKTVGLLCLLAYAGIPIPASSSSTIGAFANIECIIGDEQSIAADLSSFSAHLQALKAAARAANRRTLVLVDEIGAGTEPAAGAAIAQAFVESLIRAGAKVAVTTHYTQLKTFAATHDRVRNASMLFDARTHAPTFVFALGVPGQSLAFALARALDIDPKVIARAETLVGIDAQNLEQTFARLAAERQALEQQQTELAEHIRRSEAAEQTLRRRIAALEEEKAAFARRAETQLTQAIDELRGQLSDQARVRGESAARRAAKPSAAEAQLLAQTLAQMRRSLGLEAPDDTSGERAPTFAAGDKVFVKGFDAAGVVDEIYGRDLLVMIGSLKTLVRARDVTKLASGDRQATSRGAAGLQAAAYSAVTEIDVRGMTVDEAWPLVDKALDDATLASLSELRILHGKGTGRLARGIHEFLREHPQVDALSHPADREGGSGVTIVRLK